MPKQHCTATYFIFRQPMRNVLRGEGEGILVCIRRGGVDSPRDVNNDREIDIPLLCVLSLSTIILDV